MGRINLFKTLPKQTHQERPTKQPKPRTQKPMKVLTFALLLTIIVSTISSPRMLRALKTSDTQNQVNLPGHGGFRRLGEADPMHAGQNQRRLDSTGDSTGAWNDGQPQRRLSWTQPERNRPPVRAP